MQEKGGILDIRLRDECVGSNETNNITGLTPGHYLRISVSDTGPGIAPGIIDKIFEHEFVTELFGPVMEELDKLGLTHDHTHVPAGDAQGGFHLVPKVGAVFQQFTMGSAVHTKCHSLF